jgi:hypothetical protein
MGDTLPELAELQRISDMQVRALETVCNELRLHEKIWESCAGTGAPRFDIKATREEQYERGRIQAGLRRLMHEFVADGKIPAFAVDPDSLRRQLERQEGHPVSSTANAVRPLPTGEKFWRPPHIKRAFETDLIPNGVEPAIVMVRTTDAEKLIKSYLAGRKRRGPIKGIVDRYSHNDRALFMEVDRLMRPADASQSRLSLTAACNQLANDGRISGAGTSASKAWRLRQRYTKERRELSPTKSQASHK